MAEAQLHKLQQELDSLTSQHKALSSAMPLREACNDMVRFVTSAADPLAADQQKSNVWVTTPTGGGGCCVIA